MTHRRCLPRSTSFKSWTAGAAFGLATRADAVIRGQSLFNDPYLLVLRTTLFCLAGNMLLQYSFMLLRIPPVGAGVPVNQWVLAFDVVAILFMRRSNVAFSASPVLLPLTLLWIEAIAQLTIGLNAYGLWAIRDSSNMIDSAFLFVGYWLANDVRFFPIFDSWFKRTLAFAGFYTLLYPLRDNLSRFSPVVYSAAGFPTPIFFSYAAPTSVSVVAACQTIVGDYGPQIYRILMTGALMMVLIVFVQARLVYLDLAFLLLIVVIFKPRGLRGLGIMVLVSVALVGLFLASGIELPGRLGTTFTLDFLVNHFQAIWGGGAQGASTAEAAEGVDLRLNWWIEIHNNLQRDLQTWIFGLGYGMPLTSFRATGDVVVREPHSSFFSIYGRLGVFGVVNFLLVQIITLATTVRLIVTARRTGHLEVQTCAITILCFFGVHLIFSATEPGFEDSYVAVPYFFLSGVVFALHGTLTAAARATPIERSAERGSPPGAGLAAFEP